MKMSTRTRTAKGATRKSLNIKWASQLVPCPFVVSELSLVDGLGLPPTVWCRPEVWMTPSLRPCGEDLEIAAAVRDNQLNAKSTQSSMCVVVPSIFGRHSISFGQVDAPTGVTEYDRRKSAQALFCFSPLPPAVVALIALVLSREGVQPSFPSSSITSIESSLFTK